MNTRSYKTVFSFFVLILITAIGSFGQARKTQSFGADWRFIKGDAPGAERPAYDDKPWRRLDVPHDWSIEGPFDAKNPTLGSGGFLPSGVGWYRKHFAIPVRDKGSKVVIQFDGVMGISDVWINGIHLEQRPSGYIGFEYDLTPQIKFGGDNVIAVKADTSQQPASRWYTGAGIYRYVRLVVQNAVNIPNGGIFVSTPEAGADKATVRVQTEVVNGATDTRTVGLDIKLIAPDGSIKANRSTRTVTALAGAIENFDENFVINHPDRWDRDHPVMYRAVISVRSGNRVVDDAAVPFGIREYHFDADTGFWLNGKNFKLKGACLHHDGSAFGAAVPLAVWERR